VKNIVTKFKTECPHCGSVEMRFPHQKRELYLHICPGCLKPNFSPRWIEVAVETTVCKRRKKQNFKTSICADCGAKCSRYSKRCMSCEITLRAARKAENPAKPKVAIKPVGVQAKSEPPPVKPALPVSVSPPTKPALSDWLEKFDFCLLKKFTRLGNANKLYQARAARLIIKHLGACKRVGCNPDPSAIREILEDAARGVFVGEEVI